MACGYRGDRAWPNKVQEFRRRTDSRSQAWFGLGFVLIKDSSHGTADWQPAAFNRAVLEFLEDVEAGRSVEGEAAL